MAKTISSLSVSLGATIAPFANGMKSARESAASAVSGIKSSLGSIGGSLVKFTGIGAALAGLAGGAGLGALVSSQLDAIDTNAKLADRLGWTTESISSLQYAADLSGVSSETLTGSLEKMLKNTTAAAEGNKGLAETFQGLGLDAATLAAQSPEQSFNQIADALNLIENPAKKAAAAQEIFGKSGQQILPLLAEGSEELTDMAKEAADLGLAFNRADAAKVEEANDAISRVKAAFVGAARSIAVAIAPAIQYAADLMTRWGKSAVAIIQKYLPMVVSVTSKVFGMVSAIITAAWNGIYGFVAPIVTGVVSFIAANWSSMVSTAAGYFTALYGFWSTVFTGLWSIATTIGSAIAAAWSWAMDLLGVKTSETGSSAQDVFQTLANAAKWVADALTLSINVITFGLQNLGTIAAYALTGAAYQIVRFGNEAVYVFGTVIPGYLSWFATNWRDIFVNAAAFTGAVFTNMATNAQNFFSGLWSWMKGDGFNFEWKGLTEGFTNTVKALPDIIKREVGGTEAALGAEADALGNQLTQGLGEYLAKQDQAAKDAVASVTSGLKGLGDLAKPPKPPDITPNVSDVSATVTADTVPAETAMDGVKEKAKEVAGTMATVFAGSAESMQLAAQAAFNAVKIDPSSPAANPGEQLAKASSSAVKDARKEAKPADATAAALLAQILALLKGKDLGINISEA